MYNYQCPLCDLKVSSKQRLKSHLRKKLPCSIIKTEVDVEAYISQYLYGNKYKKKAKLTPIDSGLTPIYPELTPIDSEMTPIDSEMTPIDSGKHIIKQFKKKEEENVRKFECEYCEQELSKNSNLHRHYGRCKVKKKLVEAEKIKHQMENEIDRLIKEKSELHVRLSEAISKVGNNNNNNIVLLNFGNERIDHLDIGRIKHLIEEKGPFGALPQIFSEIYLNNDVPENMTIRYPNRKYPKLEYHKDGKWITGDKKLIIDKTTMKTFEVCKKAKSNKIEQVKQDYMNNVFTTRKRIYNDMENQLLTFKVNY
jgi:hypothetical protein